MTLPPNITGSKSLRDEYAELADFYLLKLASGNAASGGLTGFVALQEAFFRVLGRVRTLNLAEEEMSALMKLRLEELEAAPPLRQGPLFDNVRLLGIRLGLNSVEQEILAFRVLVRTCKELEGFLQSIGGLSDARLVRILSLALDRDPRDVEQALAPDGPLIGSALVGLEQTLQPFLEKLPLAPGLPNALLRRQESLEGLISFAVKRAEPPALGVDDYPHLRDELALMCRYLRAAMESCLSGVNVLLYGPPGVGKTQLVRIVAKQAGLALYEIVASGTRGEALTPAERYASYRFNQRLFARERNAVILFDEAEDALRALPAFHPLAGLERRHGKAWINRLLEENPVPAFWIVNSVEVIDPAILRRFDYILEMRNPPQSVRRRILGKVLEGLSVPERWLDEQAEEEQISPALAERAVRVLRTAGIHDGGAAGKQFCRIVENNLMAQGRGVQPRYPRPDHYSLEFVNAGTDLTLLRNNLARRAKGRLLLYGPPGSGKTAFAHHLAKELDRPLLLRRASDLVSMWLGETEKNIARMFRVATADKAVLLLDEADGFLQTRQNAVRSWEVTQVNELLTQMECFEGLFVCATNFRESLDSAALRRFGLKIRFDYLNAEQSWLMFVGTLAALGGGSPSVSDTARIKQELSALRNLTPGDFNAAKQRFELLGEAISVDGFLEALQEESRLKPDGNRRPIGFAGTG